MIPKGQIRYVWKSPPIPNGPWAMHADLPMALKNDIRATLVALPTADPTAWKDITDGKSKGVEETTHQRLSPSPHDQRQSACAPRCEIELIVGSAARCRTLPIYTSIHPGH